MKLADVSLDDKYRLERGRVMLTAAQALARLPMLQHERDRAAGLDTAGYVSGYRGSPLGGLDTALQQAQPHLQAHDVRFHPAVNEELAATAIWGTQQLHLMPGAQRDGIFALWYGKGPGVDRCGDVFKHANHAGTSRHGGVLAVAGDDHVARSSAVAHQSEHLFSACAMPVLAPSSVQEILDLGLHGWAMSRHCGCWVAMKLSADVAESSANVEVDSQRVQVVEPADFALPADGLHIRWPDPQLAQERRMQQFKIYAALAYARANGLNRLHFDSPRARLGLVASGKAWLDLCQALSDLGIDAAAASSIGLRVMQVRMPWPLEAESVRRFARGLDEILVVEEKRQIIEYQLKEMLYDWPDAERPRVLGKFDESGEWPAPVHQWLLPPTGELTPSIVARAIALRIGGFHDTPALRARLGTLAEQERVVNGQAAPLQRMPFFCPGCPHNRSTQVPEGSCALAGVGCHLMAVGMNRQTLTISQMGGEGVSWLGMADHTTTPHVFANMGDGTYFHSGLLAIRAAVAAGVNITYKLLFNDAVAMTGGQSVDGTLTVPQLTHQLAAEGVRRIVVLTEDAQHYGPSPGFAPGVDLRQREQLDATQRELRATPGVTALVFDQTCAAELRRRRKRGRAAAPQRHYVIHETVCEGCGDCSAKSNCLAIVPVDTEWGSKRAIDQGSCNQDAACLAGECPAIVQVLGGTPRRARPLALDRIAAPPPARLPPTDGPYRLLVVGVGGTGVVTVGAVLAMAAHLEGRAVSALDVTGMSQKGGAVSSHLCIGGDAALPQALRTPAAAADAVIGCDLVATAAGEVRLAMRRGHTGAVVNAARSITGEFVLGRQSAFPSQTMQQSICDAADAGAVSFVDASQLALRLVGAPMATNFLMLGCAWQCGLVPLSLASILRAIELNAVAVDDNRLAFEWGRRAAHDPAGTAALAATAQAAPASHRLSGSLGEVIARRREFLVAYQDAAFADRYVRLLDRVRSAEQQAEPGSTRLAEAVARNAFRLMAVKDEYEVARLYGLPDLRQALDADFEGRYELRIRLAVPLLSKRDAATGELARREFGPWVLQALRWMAPLKVLRGTMFDPFGWQAERRLERTLAADYERALLALLPGLAADEIDRACEIAALPEGVRGFGGIKQRSAAAARARLAELVAAWTAERTARAARSSTPLAQAA